VIAIHKQTLHRRAFLRAAGILSLSSPLVLLAGCEHEKKQPKARSVSPPSSNEPRVHEVKMVSQEDKHFFDPDRLWIQPGDTVKWVLHSMVHTATAYHPQYFGKPLRIPEKAELWHSGVLLETGKSYERKFEIEGVYNYYCTPHQSLGMVGIIVVGKPVDGPGLMIPQGMKMEGMMMEGMLYEQEIEKLTELIQWAKKLSK